MMRAMLMALCGGIVSVATAQTYPTKPVRLVIPFPAGGSNDIVGRVVAAKLSDLLGKPIVVDNRAGADGIIGSELVARAQPDGHTLLLISSSYAMNAAVHKLPYDPRSSFNWVAMLGNAPTILVAFQGTPVTSVKDVVAHARANPGKLFFGSSGVGGFNHFAGELFRSLAGIDMVHVPFKGGGAAMIGAISGEVQLIFASSVLALPHVRSGKIKTLATGGAKRSTILPNAPTIAEGAVPGYEASNWWGMVAPESTPAAIIQRLNSAVAEVMTLPDTQKRFAAEGAEIQTLSPADMGKLISAEMIKWARVAKEAGIRVE